MADTTDNMGVNPGGAGKGLTLVALAIGTDLVAFNFQQALDDLLVLSSLRRGRASRHSRQGVSMTRGENRVDGWMMLGKFNERQAPSGGLRVPA